MKTTQDEPQWLTDADRAEDLASRLRVAETRCDALLQRQREAHERDVEWALRDLTRALDRLHDLDVALEVDGVNLADVADELDLTALWRTDKASHVAELRYDVENGNWHHREVDHRAAR